MVIGGIDVYPTAQQQPFLEFCCALFIIFTSHHNNNQRMACLACYNNTWKIAGTQNSRNKIIYKNDEDKYLIAFYLSSH